MTRRPPKSKLNNSEGARDAAIKGLDLDPTNTGSLLILGDTSFEDGAYNEAATHFAALASRADLLDKDDARRMLMRFVDSLARTGSTEKAKNNVQSLLDLAPDDPDALRRAARVRLDCGDGNRGRGENGGGWFQDRGRRGQNDNRTHDP